jgi:hypothetical protein
MYFYAFLTHLSGLYQVIYQDFIDLIYKISNCSSNTKVAVKSIEIIVDLDQSGPVEA